MNEKKEPSYISIYKSFRKRIENGDYKVGDKLPSKRVTALAFSVSVITAEHAYELLEDEGYIVSKERSGYFCAYSKEDFYRVSEETATVHENYVYDTDFPFSKWAKTMRRVLSERDAAIFTRSENKGTVELRREIAAYLSRSRGIECTADRIIVGSGAEQLYSLIAETVGRDKIFGIEDPSYKQIENVYKAAGVTVRKLCLKSHGISSKALASTDAEVLHITPYRSFPSGVTASVTKKAEYINWAKNDKLIIEDDFESEFSLSMKPFDTVFSMSENDNVIYLNTFSKTVSPAVRIAYTVLPVRLAERFDKRVGFYSCTVPTFEQLVLAEFLRSGDFERHLNRVRRKRKREAENNTDIDKPV